MYVQYYVLLLAVCEQNHFLLCLLIACSLCTLSESNCHEFQLVQISISCMFSLHGISWNNTL